MNDLISVIVPVYNVEKYLTRCVKSILTQSYQSIEVILVDDGSPDNCGSICEEFAKKDRRLKVFHTDNKGVSNARNVGIEHANSEYIIFVDGDDYVEQDVCEQCVNAMNRGNTDILFFMHVTTKNPNLCIPETKEIKTLNKEEIDSVRKAVISQADPFEGYWVGPPWGKVFRKSIIQQNSLHYVLGLKKSQDRVFVYDYLSHVKTASLYYYCGYHYVSNEDSICHRYNKNIVPILENAQHKFMERVKGDSTYDNSIDTMNLIFLTEFFTLNFFNRENNKPRKERISELKTLIEKPIYVKALKNGATTNIGRKKRLILGLLKLRLYRIADLAARKIL